MTGATRSGRRTLAGRAAAWALLIAATGFASWAGWSYWQANHDPSVTLARERDQVLSVARREIAGLNSLDSANAAASLQRWLTLTTGGLHDQIRRLNTDYAAAVRRAGRTAVGRVSAAAITALHPGTAEVIAVVQVNVTAADGAAGAQTRRYQAGLTLTRDGWKISSLIAIPA